MFLLGRGGCLLGEERGIALRAREVEKGGDQD